MLCEDCELKKLTEDLGLVVVPSTYEPKAVECLELSRSVDNSGIGSLYFRGVFLCHTLENPNYLMPLGTYCMLSTYSPKFKSYLPDIRVPEHSGVRIHSANYINQLKGCVAVGVWQGGAPFLIHSKLVLDRVLRVIKENNIKYFSFQSY